MTTVGDAISGGSPYLYSGSSESIIGGPGAAASVGVQFTIEEDGVSPGADTIGFAMSWSHASDTGASVAVNDPVPIGPLSVMNGGGGPSFFGTETFPNGWTLGVVYNFLGGVFLTFPSGTPPVVEAVYQFLIVDDDVITIVLDDSISSPPVANVVAIGSASAAAGLGAPGVITVSAICDSLFVRGDCNGDSFVNLADAVWTLNELFLAGPTSGCAIACDTNSDGVVDATDATYTLTYRFLDGRPPPAPFPECDFGGGCDCHSVACP